MSESGDILIPLEEGIITKDDFTGDLGNVIKGELVGRENDDEIIVLDVYKRQRWTLSASG